MKRLLVLVATVFFSQTLFAQISTSSGRHEGYYGGGDKSTTSKSNVVTSSGKYEGYSTGGYRTGHNFNKNSNGIFQSSTVQASGKDDINLPSSAVFFKGGPCYSYNFVGLNFEYGFQKFVNHGKSCFYYGQTLGLKKRANGTLNRDREKSYYVPDEYQFDEIICRSLYYEPLRLGWRFFRKATRNNFSMDFSFGYWASLDYSQKFDESDDDPSDYVFRFDSGLAYQYGFWIKNFYIGYTVHLGVMAFSDYNQDNTYTQMWTLGIGF